MPVNSVVRVVELPKRCRIRPRRPRCGRRRLNRAELAPHLMPGNQPSHGLRARHQLYLPRQLGAGAAVSPHKRASHAAQAAAAAPPPHPRGRRDGWSCHNSLVAAPSYLQRRQAAFTVLQQAILEVPLEGCCALQLSLVIVESGRTFAPPPTTSPWGLWRHPTGTARKPDKTRTRTHSTLDSRGGL